MSPDTQFCSALSDVGTPSVASNSRPLPIYVRQKTEALSSGPLAKLRNKFLLSKSANTTDLLLIPKICVQDIEVSTSTSQPQLLNPPARSSSLRRNAISPSHLSPLSSTRRRHPRGDPTRYPISAHPFTPPLSPSSECSPSPPSDSKAELCQMPDLSGASFVIFVDHLSDNIATLRIHSLK